MIDGIFYSNLICERHKIEEILDARTSDSIALALRFDSPIFTYSKILDKVGNERDKDVKEFLLKYSKNFPDIFLNDLLSLSSKLEGSEFETGKIIIRHGVNMKSKLSLIDDLLKFDSNSRTKLLGYLHLQLFKSNKNDSFALSSIAFS